MWEWGKETDEDEEGAGGTVREGQKDRGLKIKRWGDKDGGQECEGGIERKKT